jgi:hypothetical protein
VLGASVAAQVAAEAVTGQWLSRPAVHAFAPPCPRVT